MNECSFISDWILLNVLFELAIPFCSTVLVVARNVCYTHTLCLILSMFLFLQIKTEPLLFLVIPRSPTPKTKSIATFKSILKG